MQLPRSARVALYVEVTVEDLATGQQVLLDWEISLDGGLTYVTGTRVTITEPDGDHEVIRFLLAGPDAPTDVTPDAVVTASSDVIARAVVGDEIFVLEQFVSPIMVG